MQVRAGMPVVIGRGSWVCIVGRNNYGGVILCDGCLRVWHVVNAFLPDRAVRGWRLKGCNPPRQINFRRLRSGLVELNMDENVDQIFMYPAIRFTLKLNVAANAFSVFSYLRNRPVSPDAHRPVCCPTWTHNTCSCAAIVDVLFYKAQWDLERQLYSRSHGLAEVVPEIGRVSVWFSLKDQPEEPNRRAISDSQRRVPIDGLQK
jgi:hypothetical protein